MEKQRHRRKRHNRLRILIISMGLIITSLSVFYLWGEREGFIHIFQSNGKRTKQVSDLNATQERLYVDDANSSDRHPLVRNQKDGEFRPRVYPYSVVEGGVHSVQELRSAIYRDPVVAKHYSNFKLDSARVIEAKAGGDFHVSYRIGEEIYWTKKKLKVAKGERLITDGTNFTRARCANILSEVPPGKTSPDEPPPEVFDTPKLSPPGPAPFIPPIVIVGEPPVPTLLHPNLPPFIPPVTMKGGTPDPGPIPPNPGPIAPDPDPIPPDPDPIPPDPNPIPPDPNPIPPDPNPIPPGPGPIIPPGPGPIPPTPVPEPGTLLLLGSGLIGLAGYAWKKLFKK